MQTISGSVFALCGDALEQQRIFQDNSPSDSRQPSRFHPRPETVLWATKHKVLEMVTLPSVNPKKEIPTAVFCAPVYFCIIKGNYLWAKCAAVTQLQSKAHGYASASETSWGILMAYVSVPYKGSLCKEQTASYCVEVWSWCPELRCRWSILQQGSKEHWIGFDWVEFCSTLGAQSSPGFIT